MYNDILNFLGFMNNRMIICNIDNVDRKHLSKRLGEDYVKDSGNVSMYGPSYIYIYNGKVYCVDLWKEAVKELISFLATQENRLCILTYRLHYNKNSDTYFVTSDY